MEKITEYSATAPLAKVTYGGDGNKQYYSVAFYDERDNSVNTCCSSQIGCVEKCTFCATGDKRLVRNLTAEEIGQEILDGIGALDNIRIAQNAKVLYVIMEGMGEPTYNIDNCCSAVANVAPQLEEMFDRIVFRISTAGNIQFIEPYLQFIENFGALHPAFKFQFQLSLHTAIANERAKLIPSRAGERPLGEILPRLYALAERLGDKLKCNYMLMDFPWGGNNYDQAHLEALSTAVDPQNTRLKLTKYSETGKGFKSPDHEQYIGAQKFLSERGFDVKIREIVGGDVVAACGMLDYERKGNI